MEQQVDGMLFTTFSCLDLWEILRIRKEAKRTQVNMEDFDINCLICSFKGHTFFTIFEHQNLVIERVASKLKDLNLFKPEEIDGEEIEN